MNIQNIKTQDIKPYLENPRQNKNAINVVKKSLQEFGFQQPLVLDKDNIVVAGHTRLEAAKQLNIKEVPCIIADNLSEERIKAYRIMDNKSAEYASWDLELLTQELNDLIKMDFDLELTGFSDDELEDLGLNYNFDEFVDEGLTDEDEVPEISEETVSREGDIWILGNHRVMCGDATSIDAVDKLLNKNKVDMIYTDPPYNVSFNGRSGKHDVIMNDDLEDKVFDNFIENVCQMIKLINPNVYYIWCNWKFYAQLQHRLPFKACIVWAKNVFGMGQGYRHQHEFCLFNGKIDESIKNESDLWSVKKDSKYMHPTQKPVELSIRAFSNHIKLINVLDLFGGSGSTLIGSEQANRKCFMMELDPKYVDVIIKRWQNYTGKDAYLESSEETFDQLQKIQKNTNDG